MEHKTKSQEQEPSTVMVRPFEPGDRNFILSLAPRLTIGIPAWRDPEKMLATAKEWLTASMDDHGKKTFVFVAQRPGGERLGFATVTHSKHFTGAPEAYLGELVVSQDAEGRGVGRALVDACLTWAQSQGYAILALSTGAANEAARRFYDRLGFVEEDVRLVKLLS